MAIDELEAAFVPVAPSSLPNMTEPTPELVQGVGIGSCDVSGLSAGSSSYMFPLSPLASSYSPEIKLAVSPAGVE